MISCRLLGQAESRENERDREREREIERRMDGWPGAWLARGRLPASDWLAWMGGWADAEWVDGCTHTFVYEAHAHVCMYVCMYV